MQNSIWKLAALAAVVGVGFLVVLQAQRGLNQPGGNAANAELEDFDSPGQQAEPDDTGADQLADSNGSPETGQFDPFVGDQYEPPVEPETSADDDRSQPLSGGMRTASSERPVEPGSDQDEYENEPVPFALASARSEPPVNTGGRTDAEETATAVHQEDPFADAGAARSEPEPEESSQPFSEFAAGTDASPAPAEQTVPESGGFPDDQAGTELPAVENDGPDRTEIPIIEDGPRLPPIEEPPAALAQEQSRDGDSDESATSDRVPAAEETPFMASAEEPSPPENGPGPDNETPEPVLPIRPEVPSPEQYPANPALPLIPDPDAFRSDPEPKETLPEEAPPKQMPADIEPATEKEPFGPEEPKTTRGPGPAPRDLAADDEAESSSHGQGVRERPLPQETASSEPQESFTGDAPPKQRPLNRADAVPEESAEAPNRLPAPTEADPLRPETSGGTRTLGASMESTDGRQQPQLRIVKNAPENAVLGQPFIYDIVVTNTGATPARRIVVEDRVPKGSRLVGTIPQAEMLEDTLIWKIGEMKPGQQKKIRIKVVPLQVGQIGSIATVNFVSEIASRTVVTAPKLRLRLSGPSRARLGEKVTFRFQVSNSGSGDANNVFIRNIIPTELKHPSGNDLEYEIGTLPAGQTREVNLTLVAAESGTALNKAIVTADGDISSQATAKLEIAGSPLVLKRSGPSRRFLGRAAVYANRVTNRSAEPINRVTIVETVPEQMEFVEATSGGQYNAGRRTVAWQIDGLAPGETKQVQVELTAKAIGSIESVVTASDSSGNRARVKSRTEIVGYASLSTDVEGAGAPAAVGETISLRLHLRNRGSADASNVKLDLILPEQIEFVTSQGPAEPSVSGTRITFDSLGQIRTDQEKTVTVVLKAARPGNAVLKIETSADHLSRPILREEPIVISDDVAGR